MSRVLCERSARVSLWLLLVLSLALFPVCSDDETPVTPGGPKPAPDSSLYVDATGGDDANPGTKALPFRTITKALGAAAAGDVIAVSPGTYTETIDFMGKDVSVVARAADVAMTVIDGASSGTVVTFAGGEPSSALFKGFTVTSGVAPAGGGIFVSGAGTNPTIEGNVIANCYADSGGGMYITDGAGPTITDNTIGAADSASANKAGFGGGIAVTAGATPLIVDNLITGNRVDNRAGTGWGGGIFVSGAGTDPIVQGNTIAHNYARPYGGSDGLGGGIYMDGGAMPLIGGTNPGEGNTITGDTGGSSRCESAYGAGLYIRGAGTAPVVQGNTISGNYACNGAGGIWVSDGATPVVGGLAPGAGNLIEANQVNGKGGAFRIQGTQTRVTIAGNVIDGNYGGCCGAGGIDVSFEARAAVYGNTIVNNTCADPSNSEKDGAGINVSIDSAILDAADVDWPQLNYPPCAESTNTYANNENRSQGGPFVSHVRFEGGSDICP